MYVSRSLHFAREIATNSALKRDDLHKQACVE